MIPGDIEWFPWFPTLVKGFWDIGKKQVVGRGCRCLASTGDKNWTRDPGTKNTPPSVVFRFKYSFLHNSGLKSVGHIRY